MMSLIFIRSQSNIKNFAIYRWVNLCQNWADLYLEDRHSTRQLECGMSQAYNFGSDIRNNYGS